jgi:hypothetical protein
MTKGEQAFLDSLAEWIESVEDLPDKCKTLFGLLESVTYLAQQEQWDRLHHLAAVAQWAVVATREEQKPVPQQ